MRACSARLLHLIGIPYHFVSADGLVLRSPKQHFGRVRMKRRLYILSGISHWITSMSTTTGIHFMKTARDNNDYKQKRRINKNMMGKGFSSN